MTPTTYPTTLDVAANFPVISPFGEHVPPGVIPGDPIQELRDAIIAVQGEVGVTGADRRKRTIRTKHFDIDMGNGTTYDDVIAFPFAVTLRAARLVYTGATSGTAAAATVKAGATAGGEEIIASTALANAQAVGVVTALTLVDATVAAAAKIFVRFTGVAATVAGEVAVEFDYTID